MTLAQPNACFLSGSLEPVCRNRYLLAHQEKSDSRLAAILDNSHRV
jgi:hypothetical protein